MNAVIEGGKERKGNKCSFEKARLLFSASPPLLPLALAHVPPVRSIRGATLTVMRAERAVRKAAMALRRCSGVRAARKVAATFTWTFEDARGRGDRNFPGIKAALWGRRGVEAVKEDKGQDGGGPEAAGRGRTCPSSIDVEVRGSFFPPKKEESSRKPIPSFLSTGAAAPC